VGLAGLAARRSLVRVGLVPMLLVPIVFETLGSCGGSALREGGSASQGAPAPGTATVTGTTIDAATGQPLAGVEVEGPNGARAISDASGRFTLAGLPEGVGGEVVARSKDGRTARNTLRPLANARLEVVLHLR